MASSEQRCRQWERRMAHWRASGLSLAAYCRQHRLSYWTCARWRRRLAKAIAPAAPLTLIPVVAPPRSGAAITIRLPGGIGVEVEHGFDAALLGAVVRALQVSPPC
jgi:hypothetical protein